MSEANSSSSDRLAKQVVAYKGELQHYKTYAAALKRAFEQHFPLALIQAREKTVSSFAEKAVRKREKYPDAVRMLTDLCGARIVLQTLEQTAAARRFIEANFQVLEFEDKSKSLHEDEFGYRDIHYIVQLRPDRELGFTAAELEEIGERKAEIQVRTVLQHGWADIVHDRIYKTAVSVPPEWRREANRLAALLENADEGFGNLAASLDSQTSVYEVCLPQGKLAAEIEAVRTILALEEDEQRKPDLVLKLAKLLMNAGQWREAEELLESNPQRRQECDVERGYALCCAHGESPKSTGFKLGLNLLASVAQLEEPVESPDPYAPVAPTPSVPPNLRARALYRLGRIQAFCGKNLAKALDCFRKAHALRPDNPYYHVAYVLAQLCLSKGTTLLPLVAESLRGDIERCRHHVKLGIELPNALFTMARCRMLLGETSACLCAYAKAIEVVLRKDTCVPQRLLSEEIRIVECIAKHKAAPADQVLMLLHLARWRAGFSGADSSHAWLRQRRLRRRTFKLPVLLVIGGAERMARQKLADYFSYLIEALEFFEGTVVGGGTTSGIPGVVGDVTKTLHQQGSKAYELISYLPKKLPKGAKRHLSYKIAGKIPGKEFSERELIACWCDLLLKGVPPEKIVALGINGGSIAHLEYRLALAFGAKVGVMRDSGRAAATLLADPDWKDNPRLCVLPEDKLVIWAYVNRHNTLTLSPEETEAAAPLAHKFYRQRRWEKNQTSDPALKLWKDLDSKLKQSNADQIAFVENVLKKHGFRIVKTHNPRLIHFSEPEIEKMAEREHARWLAERISEGWTYGKTKDVDRKISPSLVPWSEVPADVKDYDHEAVSAFPALLAKIGYEIQRLSQNSV